MDRPTQNARWRQEISSNPHVSPSISGTAPHRIQPTFYIGLSFALVAHITRVLVDISQPRQVGVPCRWIFLGWCWNVEPELMAEVMKHLADQMRPVAVIDHLDRRGYPVQSYGNAYPSSHTALLVAAVCGLWPWVRWPQRVVGTAVAILVACNRIYIGAHWPVDVVGRLAIGMFAGAVAWLVAARWSLYSRTVRLA